MRFVDSATVGMHEPFGTRLWPMGIFGRKKTTDPLPTPDTAAMDPLDVMQQARALVMPSDFLATDTLAEAFRYHREVADGLIALITVAHSDRATFITEDELARFDRETLWTTALQAIQHESIDEVVEKSAPLGGGGETTFSIAFGVSTFMTSRVLDMPEFLNEAVGSPDAPHGVVIAMPTRHQLAFRVAHDRDFLYAVSGMTDYVAYCYTTSKTPLSPNIYYWWPHGLDRITFPKEGGGLEIRFEGEIMEAWARLG